MATDKLTAELKSWADFANSAKWESLLLGNGASRAVWQQFDYPSLFDIACELPPRERLSPEDVRLFQQLANTKNFEAVLASLLTTQTVATALDLQPLDRIKQRYSSVQKALVAAVHRVHIPWSAIPSPTLLSIRKSLLDYDYVFSTNYDLLVYWSIMADEAADFRDYFWGGPFDSSNTEIWGKATRVLYLHGALHLYYDADGLTYKEHSQDFGNLLDLFGKRSDGVPLCITEGTALQKMTAIGRSDYLWYAFQQFANRQGPMVLLGQALGDSDRHLADAIAREPNRLLAVGIFPVDETHLKRQQAHFLQLLPNAEIHFFDSRSHPLGDPRLLIQ
jgi:hypothetical protein